MQQLIDFSQCPDSERNGSYAGSEGSKRGIVYEGQNWIVKYPKNHSFDARGQAAVVHLVAVVGVFG